VVVTELLQVQALMYLILVHLVVEETIILIVEQVLVVLETYLL